MLGLFTLTVCRLTRHSYSRPHTVTHEPSIMDSPQLPASKTCRDYANVRDPSLLRFLVDMRGQDADDKQLRDDLMTMLIAGHETTAAVLTWAMFCLVQNPDSEAKALR